MQVQVETLSPVEKKLDVEIPWAQVAARLDAAYRELGKGVKLKGFRPGKVPRPVLEKMFARQVHGDVARDLVQTAFIAAAKEHKLQPVADPVVEDAAIKSNQPFKFTARVEVRGDIKIEKLDGLAASRRKVSVEDKEIDAAIEQLRQQHTDFLPISGRTAAEKGDVLVIALKGKVGEHKVDRPEMVVEAGDSEHDPLPGLAAALVGIPFDAKDLPLKLSFAADHEVKEIAGQTAELTVSVKDARQKVVPAIDDELAKDTGEATTLAELKDKVRGKLLDRKKAEAEREMRAALLKTFVAANPIPVAPALVERGVELQLDRARMTYAYQGIDMDKMGVDMAALREKLKEPALEEVRGQLLLETLATELKVEISDAEVDTQVAQLARQQQKRPGQLKAEMQRDGSLENVRWRLRQDKALDHVVSRATITETEAAPAAPEGDAPAK